MSEGLSIADAMALGKNDDGFGSNGYLWIFFLFFLLAWGNGGIGGLGGSNSATQGALTRADLNDGFNHQAVIDKLGTIGTSITDSTYTLNNAISTGVNSINSNIVSGFDATQRDMMTGFNSITSNITALSNQLSSCCCELKTQMLQDKYDAVKEQLNLAEIASANAVQTQNILNSLGRYYTYPSVNPYNVYTSL